MNQMTQALRKDVPHFFKMRAFIGAAGRADSVVLSYKNGEGSLC